MMNTALMPTLGEQDRYFFNQGKHWHLYDLLGAHVDRSDSGEGSRFAVWAPNARQVSVVGNFNDWNSSAHQMALDEATGIWSTSIAGIAEGTVYKYHIVDCHGHKALRSDPFGFAAEVPPDNASMVVDLDRYAWRDSQWLQQRPRRQQLDQPLSIYELHLGSWKTDPAREHGWMNYRDIARAVVDYCTQHGFTHIELMPISEHPYTGSWGYQTVGYFAPTSRYGSPEDFMFFVDHCHQHNLGVLIDWVPAHFPRDAHGLRRFDGTALYEHLDPRLGEHPDWGTMIFNYGRHQVSNFLIANALFWLKQYHIDGLRVDAVASMLYLDYSREEGDWVPNRHGGRENLEAIQFLQDFNREVHQQHPGVLTMAEESTAWPGVTKPVEDGGLGFDLKWNMGWMNDTLQYIRRDSIYRKYHHNELTFSMVYAYSEKFMLPLSHDEVVHGKQALLHQMPGDDWQQFANLRLLYSYMWTHPGKKVFFMGNELAQRHEWNCDDSLQWELLEHASHAGIQRLVADLNSLYQQETALHAADHDPSGFEWIDHGNYEQSILSYLRRDHAGKWVLVICNFTPATLDGFSLGVPEPCVLNEAFNSDATQYGGTGATNPTPLESEHKTAHGRDYSVIVKIPPLAGVVFTAASHR